MENDYEDFNETARELRRALAYEEEQLTEKAGQVKMFRLMMDRADRLMEENRQLTEDVKSLEQQLDDEKRQRAELEMKLMEMGKLSAGVAKKSSEEAVLKALRMYVNRSKRKTADKRAFAKSATLEIANANGLDLPEDLKAAIESLDDEQSEPKTNTTMNVQGNYNDVHDNGGVNLYTKR